MAICFANLVLRFAVFFVCLMYIMYIVFVFSLPFSLLLLSLLLL